MGPNEWDFSTAVMREAFRLGERFVLLLPALLATVANKEQVATAVGIARIDSMFSFRSTGIIVGICLRKRSVCEKIISSL